MTGQTTAAGHAGQGGYAMQQFQSAAAPLLQLLSPGMRDLIQRIGQTPRSRAGLAPVISLDASAP